MIDWEMIFDQGIYDLNKEEKNEFLLNNLNILNKHHFSNCKEYSKILNSKNLKKDNYENLEELPYLPVRLFKEYDLMSIKKNEVIKTMTSSGTTSQKVSKIYLDKTTAINQRKALSKIMQTYLGKNRLPMLIIDSKNVIKDKKLFSARGAGVLGMMNFGKEHCFLLDENMNVNEDLLIEFLSRNGNIFIFGFTFMVWKYFYKTLKKLNIEFNLENSILVHSGGWKKMHLESINNKEFKNSFKEIANLKKIHNFYGMVEQTGSIFMECEMGNLHAPVFSDIIIRDPYDWSIKKFKESGVIQVISVLPYSYPGHSILTEDIGYIKGEDDCACGRKGKYFKIEGRIPRVELRGCSDTYAFN